MGNTAAHKRGQKFLIAFFAALLMLLAIGAAARAQDRIYWTSFSSGTVQWANLDGSGGIQEVNPGAATISPKGYGFGNAIDPVTGRVYWANQEQSKINWANLDGSGGGDLNTGTATVSGPSGLSFDPNGHRVFWSNESGPISYARVDGSGGGDLNTTGATTVSPYGATVDPATNRVYWTTFTKSGTIAYANLDGSGGANLKVTGSGPFEYPFGLAIDHAAQRIYWANDSSPGAISVADLDGSNSAEVDRRGLEMQGNYGVALDPDAGRVYTALFAGNELSFLSTNGSGGSTLPLDLPKANGPNFPTIYKVPRSIAPPTATAKAPPTPKFKPKKGKRKPPSPLPRLINSQLTCLGGSWAPDLVEAHLYRAPVTTAVSWSRDGAPVEGAGKILATSPGNYRCQETATNVAGSATQATATIAIFKVSKFRFDKEKGTAKLTVALPAEKGSLNLAAKGFRSVSTEGSGAVGVLVKPKGAKKAKLAADGKLKAVVKLTYTPPNGPAVTLRVRVALKQR